MDEYRSPAETGSKLLREKSVRSQHLVNGGDLRGDCASAIDDDIRLAPCDFLDEVVVAPANKTKVGCRDSVSLLHEISPDDPPEHAPMPDQEDGRAHVGCGSRSNVCIQIPR
jgi:hypothetical protein